MRLIDADKLLKDIEHYDLSDGKFQHWAEIQPTVESEYEPIDSEDFARIMSRITVWEFVTWKDWAMMLTAMQGFVMCKKTM